MLHWVPSEAPKRQPRKGQAVIPTVQSLFFLITHIFLPPGPPKFYDPDLRVPEQHFTDEERYFKEREWRLSEHLTQTVHDALTRFRTYFNATETPGLDRCIRMLRCMIDAREESGLLCVDALRRQMADLKDGGIAFPCHPTLKTSGN